MASEQRYVVESITDYDVTKNAYCVKWKKTGKMSWEPLENLYCPELLLQFEVQKAGGKLEPPKQLVTFKEHVVAQWDERDIKILKINKEVLELVEVGHKVFSTEQKLLDKRITPSGTHTQSELEALCPQLRYLGTPSLRLKVLPLPDLPESCHIDESVLRPLKSQLRYVTQSCEESVNFFVVHSLTIALELLGKTGFSIQQQKIVAKDYKEDVAIIRLANGQCIVALIEVAFSVNSSLHRVTVSKLAECLLYGYYALRSPERISCTLYVALTDFYTWHIFEITIQRSSESLKINNYYTFSYSSPHVEEDDVKMKGFLGDIVKFCNLVCV